MKRHRTPEIEFHYIGGRGSVPYLRIGLTKRGQEFLQMRLDSSAREFIGSVDGRDRIRALRDYLTEALKREATP